MSNTDVGQFRNELNTFMESIEMMMGFVQKLDSNTRDEIRDELKRIDGCFVTFGSWCRKLDDRIRTLEWFAYCQTIVMQRLKGHIPESEEKNQIAKSFSVPLGEISKDYLKNAIANGKTGEEIFAELNEIAKDEKRVAALKQALEEETDD